MKKLKRRYQTKGFSKCPSGLNLSEVDTLNKEIDRILNNALSSSIIIESDNQTPRSLVNPHIKSEIFRNLLKHPTICTYVDEILGASTYLFQFGINMKEAFTGDKWFWHRDYPTYKLEDNIPTSNMLNILIFLDDINYENAALMYIPYSHKEPYKKTKLTNQGTSHSLRYEDTKEVTRLVNIYGIKHTKGKAGDIFLLDVNTIHASNSNISPRRRRVITLTYNIISNKATSPSRRDSKIIMKS